MLGAPRKHLMVGSYHNPHGPKHQSRDLTFGLKIGPQAEKLDFSNGVESSLELGHTVRVLVERGATSMPLRFHMLWTRILVSANSLGPKFALNQWDCLVLEFHRSWDPHNVNSPLDSLRSTSREEPRLDDSSLRYHQNPMC